MTSGRRSHSQWPAPGSSRGAAGPSYRSSVTCTPSRRPEHRERAEPPCCTAGIRTVPENYRDRTPWSSRRRDRRRLRWWQRATTATASAVGPAEFAGPWWCRVCLTTVVPYWHHRGGAESAPPDPVGTSAVVSIQHHRVRTSGAAVGNPNHHRFLPMRDRFGSADHAHIVAPYPIDH